MAVAARGQGVTETGAPKQGTDVEPEADIEDDRIEADEMSLAELGQAENSRPTLPDETADGLDDMDEEVRHQAEDLPLDDTGRHG